MDGHALLFDPTGPEIPTTVPLEAVERREGRLGITPDRWVWACPVCATELVEDTARASAEGIAADALCILCRTTLDVRCERVADRWLVWGRAERRRLLTADPSTLTAESRRRAILLGRRIRP